MAPPLRYVKVPDAPHGYVTDGMGKIGVGGPDAGQILLDWRNLELLQEKTPGEPFPVSQAFVDVLVDVHALAPGVVYTDAQAIKAVKEAL